MHDKLHVAMYGKKIEKYKCYFLKITQTWKNEDKYKKRPMTSYLFSFIHIPINYVRVN